MVMCTTPPFRAAVRLNSGVSAHMLSRLAFAALFLNLAACHSSSPQSIEERLSDYAGQIQIGDGKDIALSRLSSLDMTCQESPIKPAKPDAKPDPRFSQIMCHRNRPEGVKAICDQSVHLMIFNGRVNEISTQTAAVGGAPAEWTCRGR